MKRPLRAFVRGSMCAGYKVLNSTGFLAQPFSAPVAFVIERENWAIRWVGQYVRDGIETRHPGTIEITTKPARLDRKIVHFGSQYQWQIWGPHMSRNNRFVTSFFHGKPEDGDEVKRHLDFFVRSVPLLSKIVVSSAIGEQRLRGWGVPSEMTIRIPIGCDTRTFRPTAPEERASARERLGIPANALCIGSFQKDGQGWGDGMEPKPIKGPDTFVESVRRIAAERNVFVLLSGPARGFVKQGLERYGIPYHHDYLENYHDLVRLYQALDLYIVSSREEGGPMALMEAMASHVDVVSTRVGQAPELIGDNERGAVVDVDDVDGLARSALEICSQDESSKTRRREVARHHVVKQFDWSVVAQRHHDEVYRGLIADA